MQSGQNLLATFQGEIQQDLCGCRRRTLSVSEFPRQSASSRTTQRKVWGGYWILLPQDHSGSGPDGQGVTRQIPRWRCNCLWRHRPVLCVEWNEIKRGAAWWKRLVQAWIRHWVDWSKSVRLLLGILSCGRDRKPILQETWNVETAVCAAIGGLQL